jgi:hypothetical protein
MTEGRRKEDPSSAVRRRMLMKKENMECLEMFQKWAVGDLKIDGVKTPRFY